MLYKKNYPRILFLLFFLILTACVKLPYNYQLPTKPPSPVLRLATYNVNWGLGVKPNKHPERTIEAMKITHADIILLQETTPFWEKLITKKFHHDYPYIQFHDDPLSGLGVISKYPFQTKYYFHPRIGWHYIWIIQSQTAIGTVQIANIHLSPPVVAEGDVGILAHAVFDSMPKRLHEIQRITSLMDRRKPVILAGDFNEGDLGRAVIYLRKNNFIDGWQQSNNENHTWEWTFGLFKFYDQLDRVYYKPPLQLINIQVLHLGDSDHYPVIADFRKGDR